MKLVLTEERFKSLLSEMVKGILLEVNEEQYYQEILRDYLVKFGKPGQLPSSSKEELIDYCDSELDRGFELSKTSYGSYIRNAKSGYNKDMFIHMVQQKFLNKCYINERGLLFVQRAMTFNPNDNLKDIKYDTIGECWTWNNDNTLVSGIYGNNGDMRSNNILLKGYVHPSSVNWAQTLSCMFYGNDKLKEIRMKNDNAFVELFAIVINGKEFKLPQPYVVKCHARRYFDKDYHTVDNVNAENSLRKDVSLEKMLQQDIPLDEIFTSIRQPNSKGWSVVRLYNKSNLINVKTRKLYFQNYDTNTWFDCIAETSIENWYYVSFDTNGNRKYKSNLFNIESKKCIYGDLQNIEQWFDNIEDSAKNGWVKCRFNDFYNYININTGKFALDNNVLSNIISKDVDAPNELGYVIIHNNKFRVRNVYDVKNKKIFYGELDKPETWLNYITFITPYLWKINKNKKVNIYNLQTHQIIYGDFKNSDSWCDEISYSSNNNYPYILKKNNLFNYFSFDKGFLLHKWLPFEQFNQINLDDYKPSTAEKMRGLRNRLVNKYLK